MSVVQVYTRPGHYMGHTSSEDGWKLIFNQYVHQRGLTQLTELGPFIDNQRVVIPAGETASFYVYTTQKLSYQYSSAWQEGNVVREDENLRLFAGIALAYGQWEEGCAEGVSPQPNSQCLFTPRVFSGVLEYAVASSTTVTGKPPCFSLIDV